MKHLLARIMGIGVSVALQFLTPVLAADETEITAERIHSTLPLYTFDWELIWPRSLQSSEEFGCYSRVAFGDWRFTPNPDDEFGDMHWERFANYGAFHCAAIFQKADDQSELDEAEWKYGFFVQLGTIRKNSISWELWALQKGTLPGSEYVLLAREASEDMIDQFVVLQQHCPAGTQRQAEDFGIWATRYCLINSRGELLSLARKMFALPALGLIGRTSQTD